MLLWLICSFRANFLEMVVQYAFEFYQFYHKRIYNRKKIVCFNNSLPMTRSTTIYIIILFFWSIKPIKTLGLDTKCITGKLWTGPGPRSSLYLMSGKSPKIASNTQNSEQRKSRDVLKRHFSQFDFFWYFLQYVNYGEGNCQIFGLHLSPSQLKKGMSSPEFKIRNMSLNSAVNLDHFP